MGVGVLLPRFGAGASFPFRDGFCDVNCRVYGGLRGSILVFVSCRTNIFVIWCRGGPDLRPVLVRLVRVATRFSRVR